ncbi:DUF2938 family protein [bacterium]|nr:DUF2938 family protein [bacterium]
MTTSQPPPSSALPGSAFIDAWSLVLRHEFHVATLDYAMLGRWIGHFPRAASSKHASPPLHRSEANGPSVGWRTTRSAWRSRPPSSRCGGFDWAGLPNIVPPLVVGFGSVLAPWLVMHPAFGAGICGRNDPPPLGRPAPEPGHPHRYGLGLYVPAVAISLV